MAKYVGPKDRLSRRENFDIFGAGAKLTRLNVPPGVHGPKGLRGSSQYGRQLREKQKVKRLYGILEKQFRRYVEEAFRAKGNTGEAILISLEKRLDNVIYRLGFAPSRPAARQLVSHRHAMVNSKKVNIPSYKLVVGDTVSIDSKAGAIPEIKQAIENKDIKLPGWLEKKALVGRVSASPKREDITEPISEMDIVEFYSR
ncbi:MAG: 30S ribosomal protein S4 [Candidatus Woesebacteria bacterium]|nr:30S ribosomal protein S4 [Candidatus Woesebacteria bacterium]